MMNKLTTLNRLLTQFRYSPKSARVRKFLKLLVNTKSVDTDLTKEELTSFFKHKFSRNFKLTIHYPYRRIRLTICSVTKKDTLLPEFCLPVTRCSTVDSSDDQDIPCTRMLMQDFVEDLLFIASHTKDAIALKVDIVLKDRGKCKESDLSAIKSLNQYCHNMLLFKVVTSGSSVNLLESDLARIYGICHVIIKQCQTTDCMSDSSPCLVTHKTCINIDAIQSEEFYHLKLNSKPISLGGISDEIKQLSLLLNYNKSCLNSPHRPVGVILHGPPGCGKTSLVKYLAHKCDAVLINVEGTDVLQSEYGLGAGALKSIFRRAVSLSEEGCAILFIDEIDTLCPRHEKASLGNKQLTSALVAEMDRLHDNNVSGLLVVAATNFISSVSPVLRRPGRFDHEVLISVPTQEQRVSILQVQSLGMNLGKDVSLPLLALWTTGYVGADLQALCEEAVNCALCIQPVKETSNPITEMSHFVQALHTVSPSLKKGLDCVVELQPVKWEDIGGLEEVKAEIRQSIEWPLLYPDVLARMDLSATRGVLLYGPPGCCKTTLVRAAATSCHVTFLSLSGAQVYSPYVGESERIISEAFQKARALSPAILFFDEMESLVGKRGTSGGHSRVQERILSTLLNEMDGVGTRLDQKMDASLSRHGGGDDQRMSSDDNSSTHKPARNPGSKSDIDKSRVIVIGATNRPDMLDAAILRPGRLDKLIYVPPPDTEGRLAILKIQTSHMSTLDVNLEELSRITEYYSGADLKNLCKEAGLIALRESLEKQEVDQSNLFVKHEHFLKAMETVKASLSEAV